MKKLFFFLCALAWITAARAVDYPYMLFINTEGVKTAMRVEGLTMNVNGNSLQVTNSSDGTSFVLAELATMVFSTDETPIENVIDGESPISVYSVTGVSFGQFESLHEAVKTLAPGSYVISNGKTTQTIIVQ